MTNIELGFSSGDYRPTEFIKWYMPQSYFDLLIEGESHNYKNAGSAQVQALGVLAKTRKPFY